MVVLEKVMGKICSKLSVVSRMHSSECSVKFYIVKLKNWILTLKEDHKTLWTSWLLCESAKWQTAARS